MAINLLPVAKRLTPQEVGIRRRIMKSVLTSLTVYLIVVGGVIGYWLVGQVRLAAANAKLDRVVVEIDKQKDKEGSYRVVQNKLEQVLSGAEDTVGVLSIWSEADELTRDAVSIDELEIDRNDISISGRTDASSKLETFEERLGQNMNFVNSSWQGLSRDAEGYGYELVMERTQP